MLVEVEWVVRRGDLEWDESLSGRVCGGHRFGGVLYRDYVGRKVVEVQESECEESQGGAAEVESPLYGRETI